MNKQSAYEKVINEIINGENKRFESIFKHPYKSMVKNILRMVQELAEEEAKKMNKSKLK